ncbi:suppressor APC domain-containing protein 1 [Engraulis encrasicolus]|uniref:suppressor APC domain-containing protein 1 n=1 Tax=Engraulis encrasicolus TaxID=184585 RepID=UPI002FD1C679
MACGSSYTVAIVPLQHNGEPRQKALHFFLWLRELKALEQEKDSLWQGLECLERTRVWYQHRLQQNLHRTRTGTGHQQLRELKALEQEKDNLWQGLEYLDRTRLWYQHRLQQNLHRTRTGTGHQQSEFSSCMLRCRIQRVNGILGSLMSDACAWISPSPSCQPLNSDWQQRWQHCTLSKTVSQQNLHISSLQLERDELECQNT